MRVEDLMTGPPVTVGHDRAKLETELTTGTAKAWEELKPALQNAISKLTWMPGLTCTSRLVILSLSDAPWQDNPVETAS